MARSLSLGTSTNPETGELVTRPYLTLEDGTRIKILDSVDDLKAFGKPADVCKALLTKTGEFGMFAYLPKISHAPLTW